MSLTDKADQAQVGDRILAFYQGTNVYALCTTNDDNGNLQSNVDSPSDIEGLWTYLYYSHSKILRRTVGFIKFGEAAPVRVQ